MLCNDVFTSISHAELCYSLAIMAIGLQNPRNSKFCLISQICARPRTLVRTVERANPSAIAINAYVQHGTKEDTVNKVAFTTKCCFLLFGMVIND